MIEFNLKKCKTCAWLKLEDGEIMCLCQLKGVNVYVESVACSEWSEVGIL